MTERLNWTELWIFCLLFDTVVELFHSTNERLMINSMPKLKYWKMVCLFFRAIDKVKWGNPWDWRKLDESHQSKRNFHRHSVPSLSHVRLFATLWTTAHARPPCPSPTPGVHSNSCPLSWWCHPAISSSVIPFSCPQSLPASESFPMSQLFASGGKNIGVSASASVPPMNTED